MKSKIGTMPLRSVPQGYVFKFFKHKTKRLLKTPMLRSDECYVELGGSFDTVEELDRVIIDDSDEEVKILGKFSELFQIVK